MAGGGIAMLKECPNCKHEMVNVSPEHSLDENWACLNPRCGYRESNHLLDKLKKQTERDKT
jgi:hypothetical protein